MTRKEFIETKFHFDDSVFYNGIKYSISGVDFEHLKIGVSLTHDGEITWVPCSKIEYIPS